MSQLPEGFHDVPSGALAMIVTYLEMRAPAPLRGASCPAGLEFVSLPRDPALYLDLFRRVGKPWLWFGRLTMPQEKLAETLIDPAVKLFTLRRAGVPEALLELDFRTEGACELAYFGVTPKLMGAGAGAFLMDEAIRRAWSAPIDRFHVHTCTLDSPGALAFYQRSGFTPVRRQVEIAADPRISGLLGRDVAPDVPVL